MSKQPPPAPTASAVGPCPTVIQIVGRPGTGSLPSTIALPDHSQFLKSHCEKFVTFFFNFNTTKVLIILHTKFQSNIPRHFGEMDLNARVDVIIKGRRKFSNGLCEQIPLQIFCFILISINIKIYLYFIQNFSQSYLAVLEKKAILLVLLLLVTATILISLPLIQEEQLSLTGKSICTKYWLAA